MREYLFKVLVQDGVKYVHVEADTISEARKKFRELMKREELKNRVSEWFLIEIYRKVY